MGKFKRSLPVALAYLRMNFGRWLWDMRVWLILAAAALLAVDYLRGYAAYAVAEGKELTFCLLPMLHLDSEALLGSPKVLFYTLFVLLICDAPFLYPSVPYAVMRSGRGKWCAGECLYVVLAALFFMVFLAACCFFVALPAVTFANDWGAGVMDYVNGSEVRSVIEMQKDYPVLIDMPQMAVQYLNPMECQAYTFFAGWATMSVLGLVAYLLNLVSRSRVWGILVAELIVLVDPAVTMGQLYIGKKALLLSPLCWTSIQELDYLDAGSVLSLPLVCVLYGVLLMVLVAAIGLASKKIVIEVTCDETGD